MFIDDVRAESSILDEEKSKFLERVKAHIMCISRGGYSETTITSSDLYAYAMTAVGNGLTFHKYNDLVRYVILHLEQGKFRVTAYPSSICGLCLVINWKE